MRYFFTFSMAHRHAQYIAGYSTFQEGWCVSQWAKGLACRYMIDFYYYHTISRSHGRGKHTGKLFLGSNARGPNQQNFMGPGYQRLVRQLGNESSRQPQKAGSRCQPAQNVCRRCSKWDLVHQKRHLGMSLQFGNFFEMEIDLRDMMTVMWFPAQHPLPSELPECLWRQWKVWFKCFEVTWSGPRHLAQFPTGIVMISKWSIVPLYMDSSDHLSALKMEGSVFGGYWACLQEAAQEHISMEKQGFRKIYRDP